ncbi:hypothetical protein LSTR_LSTR013987 [Laodelphax striatellus]|uniref:Secreted protein n=1 Tax=Laodelphax striatellus TaxID=195883 RepID=A0A482XHF7_LAOST|nr:hypothetical protein LSTR_LSTR017678 [Laodelphax striatellus]RZF45107.1 hypothetical protein LSTR_LSTR013987 [Laodelphax striatellus]
MWCGCVFAFTVVMLAKFVHAAPAVDGGHVHVRHHKKFLHALPLRNAQNASICPFRVEESRDEQRIPVVLENVYCVQEGCRCTGDSAFKCIQLYTEVEVLYPATNRTHSLPLYHGCVCVHNKGMPVELHDTPNLVS